MTSSTPKFHVELDVFSGRANPTWPLTPEESLELLARIDRLHSVGPETQPSLGYRGFVVYRDETRGPQRWLHVGHGTVRIDDNNQMRHYRDTENIEGWLREQANARGFGALIGGPSK